MKGTEIAVFGQHQTDESGCWRCETVEPAITGSEQDRVQTECKRKGNVLNVAVSFDALTIMIM